MYEVAVDMSYCGGFRPTFPCYCTALSHQPQKPFVYARHILDIAVTLSISTSTITALSMEGVIYESSFPGYGARA
jgi:hypothetical protein